MSTLAAASRPFFRRAAAVIAVAATAFLAACESLGAATGPSVAPNVGIYELRVYTAAEG
jgi:hypothetical protein